jgi:hypothetical protein
MNYPSYKDDSRAGGVCEFCFASVQVYSHGGVFVKPLSTKHKRETAWKRPAHEIQTVDKSIRQAESIALP